MNKKKTKKKIPKKSGGKKTALKRIKRVSRKKAVRRMMRKKPAKKVIPKNRIEKTILIQASPERLWHALTDASQIPLWFSDVAECDIRNGGSIVYTWHASDGTDSGYRASIKKMVHFQELTLLWNTESTFGQPLQKGKAETFTVSYRIKGTPKGTQFSIQETIVPAPEKKKRQLFEQSWDYSLNALKQSFEELPE